MASITQESLMNLCFSLLFYFSIGTVGAFLKDLHETLTKKTERIRLGEILIGGISAAIICYGIEDSWLKDVGTNLTVLITFICGVVGFEIFGNLTTISSLTTFAQKVISIRHGTGTNLEDNKKESEKNNEESVAK